MSTTNEYSKPIRSYEEIELGETASFSKIITNEDVHKFASVIDDSNPLHLDPEYAKTTMFGGQIAYGMQTGALFSKLITDHIPGMKGVYLSQEIKFLKPVMIMDTVTARIEVIEKNDEKRRFTLKTTLYNQNDELVIDGRAVIAVMK